MLQFVTSEYAIHLYIMIGMYLILCQGFNLNFGVGRLFNLAHVAVYAIGAYTTAILTVDYNVGFFGCIIGSMCASGLCALLLGAISIRLESDYFAIGTIAFSAIVTAFLVNWKSLTRGVLGIPGIPRPELLGIDFYVNANFLCLVLFLAALVQGFLVILFKNSYARSLRAQAEFQEATRALGKSVNRTRNISFVVASACAGLTGSLFAYYFNYIDPSSFNLNEMIFVLTIVIVGSPGSFRGVLVSTIFLVLLPEPLRFIDVPTSVVGPMRQLLYAGVLFAVVYWKRERLFPVERRV